jgi:hypothetical protein
MTARSLIKSLAAATALCCLAAGCGPGLVPPRANSSSHGGFAGSSADASGTDNPSGPKSGGAGGSGSLPTTAGNAGRAGGGGTPPPPLNEADAGSEDAGVDP